MIDRPSVDEEGQLDFGPGVGRGGEPVVQDRQLAFDHLGGTDRGVGVEPQPLGVAEEQRQARLGTGAHVVVELVDRRLELGDDVVDVEHDLAQRGDLRGEGGDLIAPRSSDESFDRRHAGRLPTPIASLRLHAA